MNNCKITDPTLPHRELAAKYEQHVVKSNHSLRVMQRTPVIQRYN